MPAASNAAASARARVEFAETELALVVDIGNFVGAPLIQLQQMLRVVKDFARLRYIVGIH